MYEQIAHSLLNSILSDLKEEIRQHQLQHFYTRLGANFYAIHSLFRLLYGERDDFAQQMHRLVETMARAYIARADALKEIDLARERDHSWFLDQRWVGMALYADGFAGNLQGVAEHLDYLHELGINLVHIMPIMRCPPGSSDGGYAVCDFRDIDPRLGTLDDLARLEAQMRAQGMLLTLDVVVNHTSDQHEWAQRARQGDAICQDYYHLFPNREMPDMYEAAMPEVFPDTSPGNFTWNEEMGKWVMTVFNNYQWDLNYRNPAVFIEMLDIIFYWANRGADVLRLDAVAFLWKRPGSVCQNEREAHLILQLFKDCCQVVAPGVLFIAEAIVAPTEVVKYFGEDAINAKECEIAYNATLMALLWDAVATQRTLLLNAGIRNIPSKLERATWLNYVRCHDDIGWGFADEDIIQAGYDPRAHRSFLVDYYTGHFPASNARGQAFAFNKRTGDARISGALASLAGLEVALEANDSAAIDSAIRTIQLLHAMILSFGGIPLLFYGDALGTLNDCSYLEDADKSMDNRWMHRPRLDWERAARRRQAGTPEFRIFTALRRLIALRKEIPAFADLNNRELHALDNPALFVFSRFDPRHGSPRILVAANFSLEAQALPLAPLRQQGFFRSGNARDVSSEETLRCDGDYLNIAGHGFLWLRDA
ncbi:MAG: amylosucrase [Rhodocyclaceae bacterium]|nr:amylosucrase [Rhodocyclaceae bacterium]